MLVYTSKGAVTFGPDASLKKEKLTRITANVMLASDWPKANESVRPDAVGARAAGDDLRQEPALLAPPRAHQGLLS